MNWKKIARYAAALLIAQFVIGFFDGFFSPAGNADNLHSNIAWSIGSSTVSFLVCASVFAHMSAHQAHRPFAHALLVLLLEMGVGLLLAMALSRWLLGDALPFVILEWLVLVSSLVAGTTLGSVMRGKTQPSATRAS